MLFDIIDITSKTVAATKNIPDLATGKLGPEYFYHSLPLCVIDSVFSIGVRYSNAQKAVEAWCVAQQPSWQKFHVDGVTRHTIGDLIRVTEGHEGASLAAKFFGGNRQRTSSRNGILKAEAVLHFAKALEISGIEDFRDIRDPNKADAARIAVSRVTGQKTGISFDYLMMLAGDDSFVKADRMICGFVRQATGLAMVTAAQARAAILGACKQLAGQYPSLTPRLLDHLIWRYQRTQSSKA